MIGNRLAVMGLLLILAGIVCAQDAASSEGSGAPPPAASQPASAPTSAPAPSDEEVTIGRALLVKLMQGGTTMIFLLLVSVAGLGYAVERAVNLRRGAIVPEGLSDRADALWREGKYDDVRKLADKNKSTLARMLAVIAGSHDSGRSDVSELAGDVASRELKRHLQRAYPLAVVATISPLLGLLGTVIGMIEAFDRVAAAGSLGDASMLGASISKALITTAVGLVIAVPALSLYHFFKSRTSVYGIMLEEEVGELVRGWFPRSKSERESDHAGQS